MVLALKVKLIAFLKTVGGKGATRTEILQKFKCTTAELNSSLLPVVESGDVLEWTDAQKRGRPSTHYYHKDYASELTAEIEKATIPVESEAPNHRSSPCEVCGVAIPLPEKGRPYSYCSPKCRRAAREGGITLTEYLRPAADPRVFAEVALILVMGDLVMRGFRVARDFFYASSRLWVTDADHAASLIVIAISHTGTFPDPNEYESMAAVYRDGKIMYGGRNPIVQVEPETPKVEELEVKTEGA